MSKNHKKLYILNAVIVIAFFLIGYQYLEQGSLVDFRSYHSRTQNDIQERSDTEAEISGMRQAEMYIEEEIPELAYYENYISKKSGGKAYLDVYCNKTNPIELYDNYKKFLGYYYPVFVDEKWEDHSVSWECFFVSEDFQEILWREIVEYEFYSIEEWRATSWYKDRINSDMEFLNEEKELAK